MPRARQSCDGDVTVSLRHASTQPHFKTSLAGMMRLFVLLLLVTVAVVAELGSLCLDTNQCGPGECCLAGTMRYSPPSCQSLRHLNENCRPNNTAVDGGFTYPNGESIAYTNVYYAVCPCDAELTCDRGDCVRLPH